MRRTKIALAALLAVAAASAMAQAKPTPEWSLTGNAGVFSDYRFRGISQTNKKWSFQGGFDVAHKSGLYAGNWNSNVDAALYNGANIEMDFYAGYKGQAGALGYDVGVLHYYYPGSSDVGLPRVKNTEIYVGASAGPVGAKFYYPIGDFFSAEDIVAALGGTPQNAAGSYYLDVTGNFDLGSGFALVGHVGYQKLRGSARLCERGNTSCFNGLERGVSSYVDWKLGATYTFANGFVVGLSYIDTNRDFTGGVAAANNRSISDSTVVVSLSKTF